MKPWRCSVSDQARASAIWPIAAAAWLSSSFSGPRGRSSTRRPSAIAPEETTSRSRRPAASAARSAAERIEPVVLQPALVDQQRRADLDDDAAEGVEFRGHGSAGLMSVWAKSAPL